MSMRIKKALTFRASSIGDCLMAKYLLDNVHAQFPEARCGIVVASRGAMITDLLAAYPWIEVIEANRKSPTALFSLLRHWWGSDLVVTQYAGKPGGKFSFLSKLMGRVLARSGRLIGFSDASWWNKILYSSLVPFAPDVAPAELERRVLKIANVSITQEYPTLVARENAALAAKSGLIPNTYTLVHLFSGSDNRGLSPSKRRALVGALIASLPEDCKLVVTGGPSELAQALEAASGTNARVLAEKTTLQDMMSLMIQSRCVVSLDTGVAHIAAQLNRPLVVLVSCPGLAWWSLGQYKQSSKRFFLSHKECCGVSHQLGPYPPCLESISNTEVAHRMSSLL